jgi:hypothetical protein
MADYKEHCDDCEKQLGKAYSVVHRWLDEFSFSRGTFRPEHRMIRHHKAGIEEVRKKWGDEAALAAEIHISKDFNGKIPTEEECKRLTLFGPDGVPPDGASFLTDES